MRGGDHERPSGHRRSLRDRGAARRVHRRDHDAGPRPLRVAVHEDGAWRIPYINVEIAGRDEIRVAIERMQGLWDYFVQTTHPGTIELESDTAVGRAYILELGHMHTGHSELNYSLYHDRCQRTPDGWRFRERVFEVR